MVPQPDWQKSVTYAPSSTLDDRIGINWTVLTHRLLPRLLPSRGHRFGVGWPQELNGFPTRIRENTGGEVRAARMSPGADGALPRSADSDRSPWWMRRWPRVRERRLVGLQVCLQNDEHDLARVVTAWPGLPDHVKTAILTLVDACGLRMR